MSDHTFRPFLNAFLTVWKRSSLMELEHFISKDYQAREVTGGEISDFGYEESIDGWKQGFHFVKANDAQWEVNEISIIPLREDEIMTILSATIRNQGKSMETANIFFNTFKKINHNEWKLVRSYIEAGVSIENLKVQHEQPLE
ncbi:flavoprotein [Rossellomorea aquimaris]|uniref:flavoprotein n=1 Tax=Rossellomorea aquimaris TaxID=189382 RepID=UPI0037C93880